MPENAGHTTPKLMPSFQQATLVALMLALCAAPPVSGEELAAKARQEPGAYRYSPANEPAPSWDVTMSDGSYGGRMGRVPQNVKVQHYTIDDAGRQHTVEGVSERNGFTEIYSNSNSLAPSPEFPNAAVVWHRDDGRVADDMVTQAINPCDLAEVQVTVHGGNLDPETSPELYNVTLQLWKSCPNDPDFPANTLTAPITFNDLPDNEISVLSIPLPPGTVPPTPTIWISGVFPDNDIPRDPLHVGAGFVVGTPPEKGYSVDGVDTPLFRCTTRFGYGWPEFPHASVSAKVFARNLCNTHYLAYLPQNIIYTPYPAFEAGRDIRVADDITLNVDECELSSYEIGVIGRAGGFELHADLRTGSTSGPDAGPGSVIPGTAGVYSGHGLGYLEYAKFNFPPGIRLPQSLWVTWLASKSSTGAILIPDLMIGATSDLYATEDPFLGWQVQDYPDSPLGGFSSP